MAGLPRRYRQMLGGETFAKGFTWVRDRGLMVRRHRMIGDLGTRVVVAGANHSFKCQPDLVEQAMSTTLSWVVKLLGLPEGER